MAKKTGISSPPDPAGYLCVDFGGLCSFPFCRPDAARSVLFAGGDLLVLLGVVRDLIVDKRVHRVYAVGLPVFVVCQCIVMYTIQNNPPYWVHIANAVLR